jgi:histidine triad (HIT) family protein
MTDCIFCKIINKEIPADIIYEDANILAFLDLRPVARGHALVIPKAHSENILSASADDLCGVMPGLQKVAAGVVKATGAAGFNLHVNTGPAAGQTVFHTHFHIIPRFSNDNLKMWPRSEVEPKTCAQQAQEIRKVLGS